MFGVKKKLAKTCLFTFLLASTCMCNALGGGDPTPNVTSFGQLNDAIDFGLSNILFKIIFPLIKMRM